MKRYWIIGVVVAFIWACSSDGDQPNGMTDDVGTTDDDGGAMDDDVTSVTFDRSAMLANWADNIIIPAYNEFLVAYADFQSAYDTFRTGRTEENLVVLRTEWLDAYKSWQRVSMFEIGPAEEDGLRLNINTYPTDIELLEAFVINDNYDFSLPSNRDVKGFPALDYLINGLAETDTEIVVLYTTDITGDAYLEYFRDVISDIEARVVSVLDDWNAGYRDTFVNNDGSSATASVDRFVNDFIFYYEKFLRAGKMGIPLGVFTGTVAPQTLESFYRDGVGNELFLEGLDAVQDFFNGKHFNSSDTGESLASYLRTLNTVKDGAALDEVINGQFNLARDMVASLDAFRLEIEESTPPTDMLLAYDEVQKAVPLLKVDMVSAMSIAIDFVDADGD